MASKPQACNHGDVTYVAELRYVPPVEASFKEEGL